MASGLTGSAVVYARCGCTRACANSANARMTDTLCSLVRAARAGESGAVEPAEHRRNLHRIARIHHQATADVQPLVRRIWPTIRARVVEEHDVSDGQLVTPDRRRPGDLLNRGPRRVDAEDREHVTHKAAAV